MMYLHIWLLLGMMDAFEALFMLEQIYLTLKKSEDVRVALSLLKQTYLDLKRNGDVMMALSVLPRVLHATPPDVRRQGARGLRR